MESQDGPLKQSQPTHQMLQRPVAAITLIALLIDSLIVRSLILLAPFIRSGLGIDESQFGYVMGALMLGTLLATLPIGGLLGRSNTRWAFGTIMTVIGVGLFVVAFQNTFYGLMATLFVIGILRAGIIPLANKAIAEIFDQHQRGSTTGYIFAGIPLGGFLGALVLPALGEAFDWGAGYCLLGMLALIGGILTWTLLPKDKAAYPSSQAKIALRSLRSKPLIVLAATYGLFALSMTAGSFITLYLVDVVKISALIAGTFFGLIQLTGVVGRVFWGFLADSYFSNNRWWLLAFTSGLMVVSFTMLIHLDPQSPYWLIAINMAGFGFSIASSWIILCTLVGDVVGVNAVTAATAMILFITNVMDTGGPVLFSKALNLTQSYQRTFSIYIAIDVIVVLIFVWMAWRIRANLGPQS